MAPWILWRGIFIFPLSPFYNDLGGQELSSAIRPALSKRPSVPDVHYLAQKIGDGGQMAERARHLQEMLTHPFGKPQTKSDRSGISHLDWHLGSSIPFHWEQNFDRAKGLAAAALDVSQQSNAFLGNTLECENPRKK